MKVTRCEAERTFQIRYTFIIYIYYDVFCRERHKKPGICRLTDSFAAVYTEMTEVEMILRGC